VRLLLISIGSDKAYEKDLIGSMYSVSGLSDAFPNCSAYLPTTVYFANNH